MTLTISPWLRTFVRGMFGTVPILVPAATEIARAGSSGLGPVRKVRGIRDIVNFMNFTSGPIPRFRGGIAV
jgi:hypothetical protein